MRRFCGISICFFLLKIFDRVWDFDLILIKAWFHSIFSNLFIKTTEWALYIWSIYCPLIGMIFLWFRLKVWLLFIFFLTFYQENRIGSIIFGLFILSINWDDFVGFWLRFGSLKKTQSYLKNFHSWKQKVGYILIYI